MKLTVIFIYIFLFALCFLSFALLWHWQMANVYFVCRDKGPIGDFLPPFVHGAGSGDFFIKPRQLVYEIWSVYVGVTVLLPAVCAWLMARLYQRALKKAWTGPVPEPDQP